MKGFLKSILVFVLVVAIGATFFKYWSYIFARTVSGVISDVQKVGTPVVVTGSSAATARELFSFAIGIRESSGEIVTSSSEDRQWAVAKAGQCAEAKFYPYPPWDFDKSGTYFGARLLKLHDCAEGKLIPTDVSATPTAPPAEASPTAEEAAAAAAAAASQEAPAPAPTGN
jgi:hypothetical protein